MAICSEVAENGCAQPIAKDWNYCMRCGALLSKVAIQQSDLTATPAAQFDLEAVRTGQSNLPMKFEVQIVDSSGASFRLTNTYPTAIVRERTGVRIKYEPSESSNEMSFTLRYRSTGAPRLNGSRWSVERYGDWKNINFHVSAVMQSDLEIMPQAVVFWGRQNRRKIELRNSGQPIVLGQAQLPAGYALTDENRQPFAVAGKIVTKGAPITFYLDRVNLTAPDGRVVFRDDQLAEAGLPLEILSIPDQGIIERPKFVFGIDFGTSNTSVVSRHVKTGVVKMLEYPEPEWATVVTDPDLSRFPTAILIKGKDPTLLYYGYHALSSFVPAEGDVLVTELKSLLRQESEPYIDIHPELTVDGMLTWYFKKLKQDFIDPYRTAVVGDIESTDLYVFSLPVLDYGTDDPAEYEMQRRRTLAAAKAAGFGDNLRTVHEPVAAALKMLKDINAGDQSVRCKKGDQMVVFDSGGGTTDVAIFTLDFVDGKYVMDKIEQVGRHRVTVNEQVFERHFGGAVITQDLGYIVSEYYMSHAGLNIRQYLNEIEGTSYSTFDEVYAWSQENYLFQRTPNTSEYRSGSDGRRTELAWYKRFQSLYLRLEQTKRELGGGAPGPIFLDGRINVRMHAEGLEESAYPSVNVKDLKAVLENHLPELFKSIRSDLRQKVESRITKALFVVGGNSNLRDVRSGIRPAVEPEVCPEITNDLRSHAVALGTVETYEPNASVAPYSLKLLQRDKGTSVFEASPEQIQRGFKRDLEFTLPHRTALLLDLYVGVGEPSKLALSVPLKNDSDDTKDFTFRVHYDEIALSIDEVLEGDEPQRKFYYEI